MSATPTLPPDYDSGNHPPRELRKRPRWQRVLMWAGAMFAVLVLLVVIGINIILHSNTVHNYVLRTAQQKISSTLGIETRIGNYALGFSGISPIIDLYDIKIFGAPPHANASLLAVDHIHVGVRVVSVWNRDWYLSDLLIQHPVVNVFTDQQGHENLPQSETSSQQQPTGTGTTIGNIFGIKVERVVLSRGEVYYNNEKSDIAAELHDLDLRANFTGQPRGYVGSIRYGDGTLHVANFKTIRHNFDAQFIATPSRFELRDATLSSDRSSLILNATVENYSQPQVNAEYKFQLYGGELRRILDNQTVPTGIMIFSGNAQYFSNPDEPVLQDLVLHGTLHSDQLEVRSQQFTGPIRDVSARYTLADDTLRVQDLRAQLMGGQLRGALTTTDLAGAQRSNLEIKLLNVSLGALKKMFKSPALQNVGVQGSATAQVNARFTKALENVEADLRLDFNSRVTPSQPRMSKPSFSQNREAILSPITAAAPAAYVFPANVRLVRAALVGQESNPTEQTRPQQQDSQENQSTTDKSGIPVTGHVEAHYSSKSKQLIILDSYIRSSQANIELNGALNSKQGLAIKMKDVSLQQLASTVAAFTPTGSQPAIPAGLSGTASFDGRVRGTTSSPHIQGLLKIAELQVNGSRWQLLRTNIDVTPSKAVLENGLLQSPDAGQITFQIASNLQNWKFSKSSLFEVALSGSHVKLTNLAKAAGRQLPATGTLALKLNAHGTIETLVANGTLNVSEAVVSGQPVQSATLDFRSDGQIARVNAGVRLPAGTASATASYDLDTQDYQAQLQAIGIQLEQLQVIKTKKMELTGTLNLNASGKGNVHNPQFTASVEIPKLTIRDQTINNIALRANVANRIANATLDSQVVDTTLHGKAQIYLTGNYETVATLDTQKIPIAPLVAAYAPAQAGNINGITEIHADLRGPLKTPTAITAHITVPTLSLNYQQLIHIAAPQPITATYSNGVVDIQRSSLEGTGTNLHFQGRFPVADRAARASLLVQGTMDLKLIEMLDPDVTSSGQLQFDINSFGQTSNPEIQGQIRIVNADYATSGAPLGLQNGNGVLTITRDRLNVTRFEGTVGGGRLIASGGIVYRPSIGFDLALRARDVRLLYPAGIRSGVAGNFTITGTPQAAYLRGQISLNEMSFTSDFDMLGVLQQLSARTSSAPTRGFADKLQLDVRVHAPHGIDVSSRQMSLQGGLNLNVTGTASNPVILGRVNITNGDLIFHGSRYLFQSATLDFANPVHTEAVVNAFINTTIDQYRISMHFEGPADSLRTNYTSDPALPPADIINLLAFGKTTEAAAANPTPSGTLAAQSAAASAVASQVSSRVGKLVGISQFSIDPTLGGTGAGSLQNPGATITIQQRVTGQFFVTFSTDITQTERQVVQLQYQVTPRVSLRGTRDQNGGFAVDATFDRSW